MVVMLDEMKMDDSCKGWSVGGWSKKKCCVILISPFALLFN